MLDRAARAALRALGAVEPNPLVGCIIGRPDGAVLGMGHHRRYGGPHAEVEALADCKSRGNDPRGATVWVTLEPCNHTGKTGPCTQALIEAGVSRIVTARRDPNAEAAGGLERLRAAGIQTHIEPGAREAVRLTDPFALRHMARRPWVIAKWAQTADGATATRTGESKWISCERSRRMVHRLRARVDAILTGIGTALADDPMLTARGVRVRRCARRVVLDPELRLPPSSRLVRSANEAPVTVYVRADGLGGRGDAASELRAAGVEIIGVPASPAGLDLHHVLLDLSGRYGAQTVLTECGARLLGSLFDADLVDDALVYIAPRIMADPRAHFAAVGGAKPGLGDLAAFELLSVRRSGADAMLWMRRQRLTSSADRPER